MAVDVLFIFLCLFLTPLQGEKIIKNCSENGAEPCIFGNENIFNNCINYEEKSLSREEKIYLVKTHNVLREKFTLGAYRNLPRAFYMKKITWNEDLAKKARGSIKSCKKAKGRVRNVEDAALGKNVAMSEGGNNRKLNLEKLVQMWVDELHHLKPEIIISYQEPKTNDFKSITQMIWWNTSQIGCNRFAYKLKNCTEETATNCNSTRTIIELVCHYFPAGNKLGYPVYTNEMVNELLCPSNDPNSKCKPLNESDYKTGEIETRSMNSTSEYRLRSRMIDLWPAANKASFTSLNHNVFMLLIMFLSIN